VGQGLKSAPHEIAFEEKRKKMSKFCTDISFQEMLISIKKFCTDIRVHFARQ
jgi:hypothetical protein